MRISKNFRAMVATVAAFVVMGWLASTLWAENEQEQPFNNDALFKEAKSLVQQRDQLGAKLNSVLVNEDQSVYARIEAARLLGRLQYRPAIPFLIRYIRLRPRLNSEIPTLHAAEALAHYGNAAIPPVFEAYLTEELFNERFWTLERVLLHKLYAEEEDGPEIQAVRTYAAGIAATTKDPKIKQRIEHLFNSMKSLQSD